MKYTRSEAENYTVDSNLQIEEIFSGKNFPFDFVLGALNGKRPKKLNKKSDAAYYVTEGTGRFWIDGKEIGVSSGDLITVTKNTPYSSEGRMKFVVICSPPFCADDEVDCN